MQSAFKNKKSDHATQIKQVPCFREYYRRHRCLHFTRFIYPRNERGDINSAVSFIFFIAGIIGVNALFHFINSLDALSANIKIIWL